MARRPAARRRGSTALVTATCASALVAALTTPAAAWPGDPVRPGADGFAVGLALGPAGLIGTGGRAGDALTYRGVGGNASLRIGTEAGDGAVALLQFDTAGEPAATAAEDELVFNQQSMLTVGAEVYVRPVLSVRAGAGFAASFQRDQETGAERRRVQGLGLMAGAGYDLVRWDQVVLALEGLVNLGLYDAGVVLQAGLGASVHYY